MWNYIRQHLAAKLGRPAKMRRRLDPDAPFAVELASGWRTRIFILALFVAGLAALVFTGKTAEPAKQFVLCFFIFVVTVGQIWGGPMFKRNSRLALIFATIFIQLAITNYILSQAVAGHIDPSMPSLLIPYALAPLTLSVLLGRNAGIFAAIFVSLWGSLLVEKIDADFLVTSLLTGFVAVFLTLQVRRRSQLIRAGVGIGLATLVLALIFGKIYIFWDSPQYTDWVMVRNQSLAAVGVGFFTAIIISGILPALESLFGITTEISWVEMTDLNHPLLRRLSIEASGTFHHSLAVANLAEAAAEKVGANPTVCRVFAYYHDIGKLSKPAYFTENTRPGDDPHDSLTPTMSALVIIAHVKDGVDLALTNKLNPRIVAAIQQHHGTSLVSYFYHRAQRQYEDAMEGGKIMNVREDDIPEVSESNFRYPGPLANTKEAAIMCLADIVESASRSLESPTPQRIDDLVRSLISARLADHQLDEAPLTLAELQDVAASLSATLRSMLHSRIAYPTGGK